MNERLRPSLGCGHVKKRRQWRPAEVLRAGAGLREKSGRRPIDTEKRVKKNWPK